MVEGKEGDSAAPSSESSERGAPPRRPPFTAAFPSDPALDALVDAFEAGNFARVRAEVPALVAGTRDEAVKQAARALLARTRPDPLAALLLALSAVLLVLLSAWWITHDGVPPHLPGKG